MLRAEALGRVTVGPGVVGGPWLHATTSPTMTTATRALVRTTTTLFQGPRPLSVDQLRAGQFRLATRQAVQPGEKHHGRRSAVPRYRHIAGHTATVHAGRGRPVAPHCAAERGLGRL